MPSPSQSLRYLQVKTSLGADALILTQASGHERLGGLFEITLEFTRHTGDLNLDDLLGTSATLSIHNATVTRKGSVAHTRHFNGYFSRIAFAGYGAEGQARFHATLVPWLWFLTRTADCRIFQQKSVPDIIEEVFRDAGFSDFKKDLRGNYQPREFCVQYRETDYNFVSRLMESEGIYYHFEHEDGHHKLVLCDDMVCHKPDPKHATIKFIGGAEAREQKGIITDWNFSKQVKPGKFAHNDFNFTTPTPDPNLRLLARSSAPKSQKPKPFEIYDNSGGYGTIAEGNRYARLRMEEILADRDTAHARTDLIGVKAGCKFKLDKHPIADQNRDYLITAVHWSAAEGGYGSGGGGGNFFDCDFSCIPADSTFRPPRATPLAKIDGPQTATVCGPSGQEVYVDKHSRVKVQFHWDRYGKSDAGSSCWIRVSQPWAGGSFGGMANPRIGHEVIVEFIEADPDRPIITGRVYNGHNMPHASNAGRDGKPGNTPPSGIPQAAMMTSFKSNSLGGSGGHNEITMNDDGGKETLFFRAQKDEIHTVGHNREDTVGNDETRTVGNNRSRQVAVNEEVTVGSNRAVSVGANHTENIAANQTVTVGSNQTVTVGSNQVVTVGSNQAVTVGGAVALTIGAVYQVSVGGAMNETVGGAKATEVGAAHIETVGSHRTLTSGAKITLIAADEIELSTGAAKIVLKKSGRIEITGIHVSMQSGAGIVEIDAGGIINIKGPMVKINT